MDKKMYSRWGNRNLTVKVTNRVCGRVDIHKNISQEELGWIKTNSNLEIEVLETRFRKNKKNNDKSK